MQNSLRAMIHESRVPNSNSNSNASNASHISQIKCQLKPLKSTSVDKRRQMSIQMINVQNLQDDSKVKKKLIKQESITPTPVPRFSVIKADKGVEACFTVEVEDVLQDCINYNDEKQVVELMDRLNKVTPFSLHMKVVLVKFKAFHLKKAGENVLAIS